MGWSVNYIITFRQSFNPCTGSLILGSSVQGSSVLELRILCSYIEDIWSLVWGSLVLGLRISNPRIHNSRILGARIKRKPCFALLQSFFKRICNCHLLSLTPWDLCRQGNSLRLTLFVSPRDWYIWQARPVQYISVFPNNQEVQWNQIPLWYFILKYLWITYSLSSKNVSMRATISYLVKWKAWSLGKGAKWFFRCSSISWFWAV